MTTFTIILALVTFLIGLSLGLALGWWRLRDFQTLQTKLNHQKQEETDRTFTQLQEKFDSLALQALGKSTEQFLQLAQEKLGQQTQAGKAELDGKKTLIDQTLVNMKTELTKVQDMVQVIEKDRKAKFDVLSDQLNKAAAETQKLNSTTADLQAALSNSRVRGQWGDRMAEDVLRLAGFTEGINYQKQQTLNQERIGRPDYTFYLPQNRLVHMDVKFPLENYLNYLNADHDGEKQKFQKQFMKDVRDRVKEAAQRSYAESGDSLDYVLMFVPNEQVYTFMQDVDRGLLDDAMAQKVILCSPMTLYAILAVIRQAVDNFHLERTAGDILNLLGDFNLQWEKFVEAMEKVGQKIDASQQEFEKLTTTRRNMLEKPLRKIETLREEQLSEPHLKLVEK